MVRVFWMIVFHCQNNYFDLNLNSKQKKNFNENNNTIVFGTSLEDIRDFLL